MPLGDPPWTYSVLLGGFSTYETDVVDYEPLVFVNSSTGNSYTFGWQTTGALILYE